VANRVHQNIDKGRILQAEDSFRGRSAWEVLVWGQPPSAVRAKLEGFFCHRREQSTTKSSHLLQRAADATIAPRMALTSGTRLGPYEIESPDLLKFEELAKFFSSRAGSEPKRHSITPRMVSK
jgi:hypothetical protein